MRPKHPAIARLRIAALAAALALLSAGGIALAPAQDPPLYSVVVTPHGDNAPEQRDKPYVVLLSLDGFRFDYADRWGATSLRQMVAEGASAPQGMIPVYPSVTFPNHYSIVTGLYPDNHGIVDNVFYDPQRMERFVYSDRRNSAEGNWYGGAPLWVLAERHGMRAASFFWPGSEAAIGGWRPTYMVPFDSRIPGERRVDQVLAWLRLPAPQRPHFITLYFGEADSAGHRTGTDSPDTEEAVRQIDRLIARLRQGLAALRLPVNLIIVSDHGMVNVQGPYIDLDKFADLSEFQTAGALLYPPDDAAAARVYSQLRGASDRFDVYRKRDVPEHLHYNYNLRNGDPVVVATGPYLIRARGSGNPDEVLPKGMHGYDPQAMKEMRGVFYASGPNIRAGVKLPSFESIHVYPLLAGILGIETGFIDADLRVLQPALRQPPPAPPPPALRRPGGLAPSQPQR